MRTSHRIAVAGTALALLMLVGGCGSDDDDAGAGSSAAAGGTAAPSVSATAGAASPSAPAERSAAELFRAVAAAQAAKQSVQVDLTTSAAGTEVSGSGAMRLAGADTAADLTLSVPLQAGGAAQQLRVLVVPAAFYVQVPELAEVTGKPWVKATPGGTDPLSQSLAPNFASLADSLDPTLEIYESAAVTATGTEAVDGVEATRYEVLLDLAAALPQASGAARDSVQQLLDAGASTLSTVMWIGPDDLLRKFQTQSSAGGVQTTATATYSRWGEPVEISAPPADQVADAATLQ